MSKINVFLDLDGVVCDFPKKLKELFGTSNYDELRTTIGNDELWSGLGKVDHLFLNLEPMDNYKTLSNYLKSFYDTKVIDRFEILTSLPYSTDKLTTSKQDKIDWVRKYLDSDIPVNTVVGGLKKAKYVKNKNDILIDDLSKNIEAWENAGGTGILFTSNSDAIVQFDRLLTQIID